MKEDLKSILKSSKEKVWGSMLIEEDGKIIMIDEDAVALLEIPFENEKPINFYDIISDANRLVLYLKFGDSLLST